MGQVVHQSFASCVALTDVKKEDKNDLENVVKMARNEFLDNETLRVGYGAPVMGIKAQHKQAALDKAKAQELMKKN